MSDDHFHTPHSEAFRDAFLWDAHGVYGVDSMQYDAFMQGIAYGAGWLAALIGMGQAIKDGHCYCGDTWANCRGQCENDE